MAPSGDGGTDGYFANVHGGAKWMQALGVIGLERVVADGDRRILANGITFSGNPKWAMASAF